MRARFNFLSFPFECLQQSLRRASCLLEHVAKDNRFLEWEKACWVSWLNDSGNWFRVEIVFGTSEMEGRQIFVVPDWIYGFFVPGEKTFHVRKRNDKVFRAEQLTFEYGESREFSTLPGSKRYKILLRMNFRLKVTWKERSDIANLTDHFMPLLGTRDIAEADRTKLWIRLFIAQIFCQKHNSPSVEKDFTDMFWQIRFAIDMGSDQLSPSSYSFSREGIWKI